ncbi:MAG: hypothetical protein J6I61_08190 [Prevotella sp.]|nr:hypothetical protein [Prevotella sp.]
MLPIQFVIYTNQMINELIVVPRLVNQQTLAYNETCDYLAQGSTVTAADVSAVMKQMETVLPRILALNTKVICSPNGMTFRPAVRGSITQSQLKAKLEAKKLANPSLDIDVNRQLTVSDLATSDLTACIVIDLPKGWDNTFKQMAEFKRVTKATAEVAEQTTDGTGDDDNSGDDEGPAGGEG